MMKTAPGFLATLSGLSVLALVAASPALAQSSDDLVKAAKAEGQLSRSSPCPTTGAATAA